MSGARQPTRADHGRTTLNEHGWAIAECDYDNAYNMHQIKLHDRIIPVHIICFVPLTDEACPENRIDLHERVTLLLGNGLCGVGVCNQVGIIGFSTVLGLVVALLVGCVNLGDHAKSLSFLDQATA